MYLITLQFACTNSSQEKSHMRFIIDSLKSANQDPALYNQLEHLAKSMNDETNWNKVFKPKDKTEK